MKKKILLGLSILVVLGLAIGLLGYGYYLNENIIKNPQIYSFNVNIASQMLSDDYKTSQKSQNIDTIFAELKLVDMKYKDATDETGRKIEAIVNQLLELYNDTLMSKKPKNSSKVFSNEDIVFVAKNEKILLNQMNNFICFPKLESFFELKQEANIRKDALTAVIEDMKKRNINAQITSYSYENLISVASENREFQLELMKILQNPKIIENNEKLRQLGEINETNVEAARKIFEDTRNVFWNEVEKMDFVWKHRYILGIKDQDKVHVYKINPYIENKKVYWNIRYQSVSL